jgi:hypothetical protein
VNKDIDPRVEKLCLAVNADDVREATRLIFGIFSSGREGEGEKESGKGEDRRERERK